MTIEISKQNIFDVSLFALPLNNKRDVLLFFCNLIVPIYTIVMIIYYFIIHEDELDPDKQECRVDAINQKQRCICCILIGCIIVAMRLLINYNCINFIGIILIICVTWFLSNNKGIFSTKFVSDYYQKYANEISNIEIEGYEDLFLYLPAKALGCSDFKSSERNRVKEGWRFFKCISFKELCDTFRFELLNMIIVVICMVLTRIRAMVFNLRSVVFILISVVFVITFLRFTSRKMFLYTLGECVEHEATKGNIFSVESREDIRYVFIDVKKIYFIRYVIFQNKAEIKPEIYNQKQITLC